MLTGLAWLRLLRRPLAELLVQRRKVAETLHLHGVDANVSASTLRLSPTRHFNCANTKYCAPSPLVMRETSQSQHGPVCWD